MKFLKKLVSVAAAAVMMFTGVLVADIPQTEIEASAASYVNPYTGEHKEAYKKVLKGLKNMDKTISLSKYKITYDDYDEILCHILLNYPEIFYVKPETEYTYFEHTGNIISVYPIYYYSKDTVSSKKKKLNAAVDDIVSDVKSTWSDVQKALYVHDRIAVECEYNEQNEVRSAYEALVGGDGVCVAYAMAYKLVLDELGIDCLLVSSDSMNHCWNMVKIDGKWYHVDLTWDDSLPDFKGQIYHDFFLCSDAEISSGNTPHRDWEYGKKASSDKYDDSFWENSFAQIIPANNRYWYYIDNMSGSLKRYDWQGRKKAEIISIKKEWMYSSTQVWDYCFSRLAYSNGLFYYNTADTVYSYDPTTNKKAKVKKFSLSGTTSVYGLYINDDQLVAQLGTDPSKEPTKNVKAAKLESSKKLDAPESFKGSVKGSSITLTWAKVSGADGYTVYYYDADKKSLTAAGSVKSCKFTDSGLKKGTYSYKVKAYKLVNGKKVYGELSSTVKKTVK